MKKSIFQGNRSRVWGLVLLAVISVFGITSCQTDFDLDKTTPEWLGPSIYDYLKNNHYDTYVKLIEDLGYKDVLSKTGSKTLFVADEDAVARFFASGVFKKNDGSPVLKYEDLSLGQKKMILYGSMLNNVYQVSMLATAAGPKYGASMRRPSTASEYVDVPLMLSDSMPETEYFQYYKNNNKNIRIMSDGSNKPIIFMVNKFLVNHKIIDDDYDFLFNQGAYGKTDAARIIKHKASDASVNGVNIDEQNIKCLNGFVHKVHDVIYPLPNMYEFLESSNKTKVYYSLLSRFCAPYPADRYLKPNINNLTWSGNYAVTRYTKEKDYRDYLAKDELDELLPAGDTLFELRFFSASLNNGPKEGNIFTPSGDNVMDKALKFDPSWNSYYFSGSSNEASLALQEDMSVMLVPTDKAMSDWWNKGGDGYAIKKRYVDNPEVDVTNPKDIIEQMEKVEDFIILDLLNNNMLVSFTGSVPSKFADVLNDAQDPMEDLTTNNIDSVKICCNGAVYLTNKVMSPTSYKSVSFPTLVDPALRVINWAVGKWVNGASTGCGFFAYLNSMQSTYSFFVPTVLDKNAPADERGCLKYIDPVSYGQDKRYAYLFKYDETLNKVTANIYPCDDDGTITDWSSSIKAEDNQVTNRLSDLLDYHIVVDNVTSGYSYYQTKGGGAIYYDMASMTVKGGYQIESNSASTYDEIFPMSNGTTYVLDKPLLTSKRSVYDVISDKINYPEFTEFFNLTQYTGVSSKIFSEAIDRTNRVNARTYNLRAFNTYHYSVYVPDNNSIIDMVNHGVLMNITKLNELEAIYKDDLSSATDKELVMSKIVYDELSTAAAIEYVAGRPRPSDGKPNDNYSQKYLDFKWSKFKTDVATRNVNFIKMHIQDKSLYIGGKVSNENYETSYNGNYETSYIDKNSIFQKLKVESDPGSSFIKLTGLNNIQRTVTSDKRLRNIMCREYTFENLQKSSDANADAVPKVISIDRGLIETSSFAVIHSIDGPLCSTIEELSK